MFETIKKLLKKFLSQNLLSSLALINCELDDAKSIDYETVIDEFASTSTRKLNLI